MYIKELEFLYETSVVSKVQFEEHLKLYRGYINKLNEITDKFELISKKNANATYSEYRSLKDGESFALNGVILHEYYFQNIGHKNIIQTNNLAIELIEKEFNNYDNWLEDFKACAKASRGWVIFGYDKRTKVYKNIMLDAHDKGIICDFIPLCVLDCYEHSYFITYGTNKNEYIDNFSHSIRWDVIEDRVKNIKEIR